MRNLSARERELLDVDSNTLFERIPVYKVFADKYTRPVSKKNVQVIIDEGWNEHAAGAIYVSMRADGRFAILDGWHRVLAAQRLEIQTIAARVYLDLTYEQEARLYVAFAKVKKQTALDRYRALVEAKDEMARSIDYMLTRRGLVASSSPSPGHVRAVHALFNCHAQYGYQVLDDVIGILYLAWGKDANAYRTVFLEGACAFWVRYRTVADVERLVNRMRKVGIDELSRRVNALRQASLGSLGASALGRIFREMYNEQMRETSRLPEWPETVISDLTKERVRQQRRERGALRER